MEGRRRGRERALWQTCEEAVVDYLHKSPTVKSVMAEVMPRVHSGEVLPRQAAQEVLKAFRACVKE